MSPNPHQDPEYMTLEFMTHRVKEIIVQSLSDYLDQCGDDGRELDLEQLVVSICDEVRELERKNPGRKRKYFARKRHKANLNSSSRPFLVNTITFNWLEPYKKMLLQRNRARLIDLEDPILITWFVAMVLDYAVRRHSLFALMVILKILFIYDLESVTEVKAFINLIQQYDFDPSKQQLRDWKSDTIREIQAWYGEDLIKLEDRQVGAKIEKHFVCPVNPAMNFAVAVEAMKLFALYRTSCVLDDQQLKSKNDVRKRLENQNISDADGIERMLIHMLSCPEDLFTMVTALQLPTNFEERLGVPWFFRGGRPPVPLAQGSTAPPTPQRRRDVITNYLNRTINVEPELRQRDIRRNKLKPEYAEIVVDNVVRETLFLNKHRTVELDLQPGDTILTIRGFDQQGSLPLDVYQIPWGMRVGGATSHEFSTKLNGGARLKFSIRYRRDATGDLTGAMMEVVCIPKRRLNGLMRLPTARPARAVAAVGLPIVLVVGGLFLWRYITMQSRNNPIIGQEAAKVSDVGAKDSVHFKKPTFENRNSDNISDRSQQSGIQENANAPNRTGAVNSVTKPGALVGSAPFSYQQPRRNSATQSQSSESRAWPGFRRNLRAGRSLFEVRSGRATVLVRDARNRPIPHAFVVLKSAQNSNHRRTTIIGEAEVRGFADEHGRFALVFGKEQSLRYLKPGVYNVIVGKEGYVTARLSGLKVTGKVGRSLRVVLRHK